MDYRGQQGTVVCRPVHRLYQGNQWVQYEDESVGYLTPGEIAVDIHCGDLDVRITWNVKFINITQWTWL